MLPGITVGQGDLTMKRMGKKGRGYFQSCRLRGFRPRLESLEDRFSPAVATWTGSNFSVDDNWSDSSNWAGDYAPHVGDDVVFPSSAFTFTSNNDFATSPNPAVIGNILFPDPVSYSLTGNELILNGGITDDSGANNFIQFSSITLGFSQSFVETVSGPGVVRPGLVIHSAINLNGNVLTLTSFDFNLANEIGETTQGVISGDGEIDKSGTGVWLLAGNNTYTGPTVIDDGPLAIATDTALGSIIGPNDGTLVNSGGTLVFYANTVTFEPLTINGNGDPSGGGINQGAIYYNNLSNNPIIDGPITLGSDAHLRADNSGHSLFPLLIGSDINTNGFNLFLDGTLTTILTGNLTGSGFIFQSSSNYLSGTGTISCPVDVNSGYLSPGNNGPGILTTGTVTFQTDTAYSEIIDGSTVGSGYSQLQVNGDIVLGGASLDTKLNFAPAPDADFTIMEGTGTITGTFNGLPDGSTVVVGTQVFFIHYYLPGAGPGIGGVTPNAFVSRVVLCAAPVNTTTVVGSSQNPASAWQILTFTATVTSDCGGTVAAVVPAGGTVSPNAPGTVTFMDGGTPIGTSPIGNGVATFNATLAAGNHSITAIYNGSTNFLPSSASAALNMVVYSNAGWHDVLTGDFLGNGKQDIAGMTAAGQWWLAVSNGTSFTNQLWGSWNPNAGWQNVMTGDFLGNGKQDIAGMTATGQWWVAVSNGLSFTNQLWTGWNPNVTWVDVKVGDFSGDGKADIVGRYSQAGQWWVAQSTGSSFTNSLWASWNPNVTWVDVNVGHFAGSIRSDLTGRWLQGGSWWTAVSTGSSFTTGLWASWNPNVTWVDVKVADFDNDGKTDLTARWLQGGSWWAAVSTGSSFTTGFWASWNPNATWVDVQVADFNDDGKVDIAARYLQGGSWYVGISNGTSFVTGLWGGWSPAANWVDVSATDLNGDGFTDLVGRYGAAGQWWAAISNGANGFANQLWTTWAP
jgi:autotransporter-associated beta strand protein